MLYMHEIDDDFHELSHELSAYWDKRGDCKYADGVCESEKGSWLLWNNCFHCFPTFWGEERACFSEKHFVEFISSAPRKDVRLVLKYLESVHLNFDEFWMGSRNFYWEEDEASLHAENLVSEDFFVKDLARKLDNMPNKPLDWVDIFDLHRDTRARGRWIAVRFLALLLQTHKESVERVNHPERLKFVVDDGM